VPTIPPTILPDNAPLIVPKVPPTKAPVYILSYYI